MRGDLSRLDLVDFDDKFLPDLFKFRSDPETQELLLSSVVDSASNCKVNVGSCGPGIPVWEQFANMISVAAWCACRRPFAAVREHKI